MDSRLLCEVDHLRTGDLIFFDEHPSKCPMWALTSIIKCCTRSLYSHVAFVIVDPPWTQLKGCFVWESSSHGIQDPQDDRIKFGVQLTPLSFYLDRYPGFVNMYVRRPCELATYQKFQPDILKHVHEKVYEKPYDTSVKDWLCAWLKLPNERITKRFFCSAFVCFILTETGIIASNTNWTQMTAANMSSDTACHWMMPYEAPTLVTAAPRAH